jgi:hypothetical protein
MEGLLFFGSLILLSFHIHIRRKIRHKFPVFDENPSSNVNSAKVCSQGSGEASHIATGHATQLFNDLHYSNF